MRLIVSGPDQSPEFSIVEMVMIAPRSNPPILHVIEPAIDPSAEVSLCEALRCDGRQKVCDTLRQGAFGVTTSTVNVRFVKERQSAFQALPNAVSQIWWTISTTGGGIIYWVGGGPNH